MTSFDSFETAYHNHFTTDPNRCVFLGVTTRDNELPDPSLDWAAHQVAEARKLLQTLEGIVRDELSFEQQLDWDLAHLGLRAEIHGLTFEFNGRTTLHQMPTAADDIGDGMFLLFINDPRPSAVRLEAISKRIAQVPAYLEALLSRLDTPVQRWVSMDLEKVAGLPTLFSSIVQWAETEAWSGAAELQLRVQAAEKALEQYKSALAAMPTTNQLHVGATVAQSIVALCGIEMSLDELHAMAVAFLARTRGEIDRLRDVLVAKYDLAPDTSVADLHTHLNKQFAVSLPTGQLSDVLDRYQAERRRILAYIAERDLFPVFADQDMKVMQTPSFMEPSIPAGAMMPPAPFRTGTRTSLVYLTLSQELLDEHTELSIPNMMIHEGIPGHHLQLATASLHPSLVRKHCSANDHAEGWTTMLEDFMLDLGYMGELTDEARFCGKRDISRIGARVAIDLFLMSGEKRFLDVGVECDLSSGDPFEAAGNLLQAVTGFVPGRVQAELNWYSQERGYPLSYLTGNTLVWGLKHDLEAANADDSDAMTLARRFHRTYLESGNMPVRFLRTVFENQGQLRAG